MVSLLPCSSSRMLTSQVTSRSYRSDGIRLEAYYFSRFQQHKQTNKYLAAFKVLNAAEDSDATFWDVRYAEADER